MKEDAKGQAKPDEEAKKRYYTPGEVMKKKGCIGCGGMLLTIPVVLVMLVWMIAGL